MGQMTAKECKQKMAEYGFMLSDLSLYLDTNPTDAEALSEYVKYQNLYLEMVSEYETHHGPMNLFYGCPGSEWIWSQTPWPWQNDRKGCD